MGLFSFLKNAGISLGRKKGEQEKTIEKSNAAAGNEAMDKLANSQMAMRLTNYVVQLGLKVENLNIEVDGEKAMVQGKTNSKEEKEKVILAVGNVEGIATVDDRISVEEEMPAPEAAFYEVKKGDTLSAISKKYYGNANRYREIFEANRPMLADPDKIYPGQMLRIPQEN